MGMSKVARNERCKLAATFLNNIAVGCFISEVILPAWAFYQWLGQYMSDAQSNLTSSQIIFNVTTVVAGCALGLGLHRYASWILNDLED